MTRQVEIDRGSRYRVKALLNRAVILTVLVACLGPNRQAMAFETLFDNFYQTPTSFDPNQALAKMAYSYTNFGSPSSGSQFAYAFRPSITATVDQIILPLDVFNAFSLRCTVALYADNNGLPGATLMSQVIGFDLPSGGFNGSPNITPLFPVNPPTVEAGSQYWVSVNVSNADNTSVRWYVSTVDFSSPGAYRNAPNFTWVPSGSSLKGAFYVGGTAVPEPAGFAVGAMGLMLLSRRRCGSNPPGVPGTPRASAAE